MTQFDERERAFESKFGHDEEFEFRVAARAAKLFGQWAAEHMNLRGQDAEAYASRICELSVAKSGIDNVVDKVACDLQNRGIVLPRRQLEKEMAYCEGQARAAI